MIGMEFVEVAQLVVVSGGLVYLGRLDQKLKTLCGLGKDHEKRLRRLERPVPASPTPVRAVLRRIDEASP